MKTSLTLAAILIAGLATAAQAQQSSSPAPAPVPAPEQAGPATATPPGGSVHTPAPRVTDTVQGPEAGPARPSRRPAGYRSARYDGGEGASWRTGLNSYGFAGSFGGCRYRGVAGPGGYRLLKSC